MIAGVLPLSARAPQAAFEIAMAFCKEAERPARVLDAKIALALFPSLRDLAPVEAGIWRQEDGSHVRALRYSQSWQAAASIVPAGCWIEAGPDGPRVCCPHGDFDGTHEMRAIALCIAALGARIGEANLDPD
jgi:hypothetical protein